MLARLQKIALFNTLLAVLLWAWWWRDAPPWVTWALAWVLVVVVLGSLALEFVLLARFGCDAQVSKPTVAALVLAWLSESLHATRVFGARQPFAAGAYPDTAVDTDGLKGAPGVLLIHGYLCNRGFWNPWLRVLQSRGVAVVAVNLEPVFAPIDQHIPQIDEAVRRLTQITGVAPVIVCHSMGGLVARAWLRAVPDAARRCAALVTIASPHAGTWLERWSGTPNGRQMRLHSEWLGALAQDLPRPALQALLARSVCWYSDCDNIVFPVRTATLSGADNRFVPGRAHIALAFDPRVMRETLSLVAASALRSG